MDYKRLNLIDIYSENGVSGYLKDRPAMERLLADAKDGGKEFGKTKRGKGVKIMGIADRNGLPIAVAAHAANHHGVTLVQLAFEFYMIEAKPEKLIGDKAYDGDALDEELSQEGIDMIAPHRTNRLKRNKTQDGRKLRRYNRRWLVERFFAWLHCYRRLPTRWEWHAENFLGFARPASICILLKRF